MNNSDYSTDILGKKIFFLHPAAVVQNRIIPELVQQEYEVYIIKDHTALRKILRKYSDSIVFIDIGEHMAENEWEAWVRTTMVDPVTKNISFGVVTAIEEETLQRKYINSLRVSCGYTLLKSNLDSSIKQIDEILKMAGARGRRKYLRAITDIGDLTTVNLPLNGEYINGTIKDISVVGLSCSFDHDPELVKNTLVKDIQIKLQSSILKGEGIIFGTRMDGLSKVYVLLFTQRIDPDIRTKIRKYIQYNLQSKMDKELV